jgi:transcriptional regulator GlxA family with amidase domain
MRHAEIAEIEGVPLRVVRADYLAVIALSVGRAKDLARILALLEAGAVTPAAIERLAEEHGLSDKWRQFRRRFDEA